MTCQPNGRALRHESLEAVVLLLNPITPHISHALWQALGHGETLLEDLPFPQSSTGGAGARCADAGGAGQRQVARYDRSRPPTQRAKASRRRRVTSPTCSVSWRGWR
jgi:hypothetical protein